MKLLSIILLAIFLLGSKNLFSNNNLQIVKGKIVDAQSLFPIPGVTVIIVDSDPLLGSITDEEGYFKIQQVPIGRVDLKISYVGYQEVILSNVLVSSGKEVVLNVKMEESVQVLNDLVISASDQAPEVSNEMATLSARSFNVEETQRYAGSRNDPARMATNFAGVSGANDGRNDIIIRGNSPTGLLWRLEGMDIPSPNHFAALGTTGGPVSILNNNLLSDSEFYTGAFPSMYGNALSGVFDLQMRNGNYEKHEFIGQIGFNGAEFGAEGPITKNTKSSYLVNYRYSLLAIMDALGLSAGTGEATPYYQDLSFKLNFQGEKGRISVFGIGGRSHIDLLGSETSAEEAEKDLYGDLSYDIYNTADMGVIGVNFFRFLGKNAYLNNSFSASYSGFNAKVDTVIRNSGLEIMNTAPLVDNVFGQYKYSYNIQFNKKFNSRNNFTTGFSGDLYQMDLNRSILWDDENSNIMNGINFDGSTFLIRAYLAWQHKFNDQWILNSGLHYQQLTLNDNSVAIEPRLGLKYRFLPDHSLSLAYGRHNQMQGMVVYFVESESSDGSKILTNKNLGFTTSNHFVAAYDWQIKPDLRLKLEAYVQDIFNVPVKPTKGYFSMLNAGADFGLPDEDSLVNQGTGKNKGVELTLEKYFNQNWYFLVTGSLFDSKYRGSDGIERNTVFNGNYVVNALVGKELPIGKKNNSFGFDIKFTAAGNRRYIPIDLASSQEMKYAVYDFANAYEDQFSPYLRADFKLTYRKQHRKITEEFLVDIQNVFNNQNVFDQSYNALTGTTGTTYQLGIFPVAQYRILF